METQEKVKVVTPQMLVQSHEKNVKKSLEAHGLIPRLTVHFKGDRTPLLGQLGVWLVNKAGGQIVIKYGFSDTITSETSPKKE